MRSTTLVKPADAVREWYHVDASGKVLGRLAVVIARTLMGKHKPEYTAHIDVGDFVIVTNVDKIVVTGTRVGRPYTRYSGFPGGLKLISFEEQKAAKPEEIIRQAVKRMLPKNNLSRHRLTKLKLYASADHPHQAQLPKPLADNAAWIRMDAKDK